MSSSRYSLSPFIPLAPPRIPFIFYISPTLPVPRSLVVSLLFGPRCFLTHSRFIPILDLFSVTHCSLIVSCLFAVDVSPCDSSPALVGRPFAALRVSSIFLLLSPSYSLNISSSSLLDLSPLPVSAPYILAVKL